MAKKNAYQQAQEGFERLKQQVASQVNTGVRSVVRGAQPYISDFQKPRNIHSTKPNKLGQAVFNTIGNFNPAYATPFAPPVQKKIASFTPTIGQYAQGQIIKPIQQGVRTASNSKLPTYQRALGGVQAAFGGFGATPAGIAYNVGSGVAAGVTRSLRTKQPVAQSIRKGISEPTSIGSQGLGIKNPFLALGADVLLSRNPKSIIKDPLLIKSMKGIFKSKVKVDPNDVFELDRAVDAVRSKKVDGRTRAIASKIINDLSERYLPKELLKSSNNDVRIKALQTLMKDASRATSYDIPGMGLVSKAKASETKTVTKDIGQGAQVSPASNPLNKTGNYSTMSPTKSTPLEGDIPQNSVQDYIQQLGKSQKEAAAGGKTIRSKTSAFLSGVKKALVDKTAPIEDVLGAAEKRYKFNVRPTGDVRLQIDRVLRAKTLGAQFAEDNGLSKVIKDAPDLNTLDQYMIAKQAKKVAEYGKQTGRNSGMDDRLIQELAPQYEAHAKAVNQYSQKLLDYSVDTGLIDKGLAAGLKKKYPEYVPLNRIFNELETKNVRSGTKALASLSRQTVVQKLEGSTREIASPIESLLVRTQQAFEQGEKNKAAKMLASYEKLPGFEGLLRELKTGENAVHTISYLEGGVKKIFATTPEIEAAAKNLDQQQMNVVTKILSMPTRVLQLGATGLNVPFVATNLLKDQITSFINSNKAASTSIANPVNFLRAMFSAVKHDDLYKEMVRKGGGGTSFDIAREAPNLAVNRIRAGKSVGSKIAYTAKNPQELLRALENTVGRSEELTRIQQYKGTRDALLREGRTLEDAQLLAAKAARENTANFARSGDIGKVINYVIPFFNAGIQGARVLVRQIKERPLETGTKLTVAVFTPIAAVTAWNLKDPKRAEIYNDIPQYEKDTNLIIIPDNVTKDERGRYNVIKIPIPPGLSNLGTIVRRGMEQAHGLDSVRFDEVANNLLTAGTSIDVSSSNKVLSTFTPQAVKPFIETQTNTNLFTGNKIVPDSLRDLPPEDQVKDYTSGTARMIGKQVGQSPLKVENFVKTAAGGLGSELLNASDTALNVAGKIPSEQVGGESIGSQLERRFRKATGGAQEDKRFDTIDQYKQAGAVSTVRRREAAELIINKIKTAETSEEKIRYYMLAKKDPELLQKVRSLLKDEATGATASDRAVRGLSVQQRAKFVRDELLSKPKDERVRLYLEYKNKGIITKDVLKQMVQQ